MEEGQRWLIQEKVEILGVGRYLPKRAVTSAELEKQLNIPQGWSKKYSGVDVRYYAEEESSAFMGARALEEAVEHANLTFGDLDLLICASTTFDYLIPNQGCMIKLETKGGASYDIPTINIDSTCLSFVTAFDIASQLLQGSRYNRIGIVSVEIASNGLNPEDWETATLFGDGAAAVVLGNDAGTESGIMKAEMKTYSENIFTTHVKGGGNAYFFREHPYNPQLHSFAMQGKTLLKMAKEKLPEFIDEFFEPLAGHINDVDVIIPHQASKFGLMLFRKMYGFEDRQFVDILASHGNCISVSIPTALYEAIHSGQLKRGMNCLMIGTSAGFSIGSILFKY